MSDDSAVALADPETEPARRHSVSEVVALGAALLLVGALAWGGWWFTHPRVFDEQRPATYGAGEDHPAAGPPWQIDMMVHPRSDSAGSVTLLDAQPHVLTNTAGATFEFHVCLTTGVDVVISARDADLSPYCAELRDVDGAKWSLSGGKPRHQLVMTMTTDHPGVVRIRGVDLTYRDGVQRGTQRVGAEVWFNIV